MNDEGIFNGESAVLGQLKSILWWVLIVPEIERLVHPVLHDAHQESSEVEDRDCGGVHCDDEEHRDNDRVSALDLEPSSGIKLLVVSLKNLFGLSSIARAASSIPASYTKGLAIEQEVGNRCYTVEDACNGDGDTDFCIPL